MYSITPFFSVRRHLDRYSTVHWTRSRRRRTSTGIVPRHFRLLFRSIHWSKVYYCIFVGSLHAVSRWVQKSYAVMQHDQTSEACTKVPWDLNFVLSGKLHVTSQHIFFPVDGPFVCSCLGLICLILMRFACFWMSKKLLQRKFFCTLH